MNIFIQNCLLNSQNLGSRISTCSFLLSVLLYGCRLRQPRKAVAGDQRQLLSSGPCGVNHKGDSPQIQATLMHSTIHTVFGHSGAAESLRMEISRRSILYTISSFCISLWFCERPTREFGTEGRRCSIPVPNCHASDQQLNFTCNVMAVAIVGGFSWGTHILYSPELTKLLEWACGAIQYIPLRPAHKCIRTQVDRTMRFFREAFGPGVCTRW